MMKIIMILGFFITSLGSLDTRAQEGESQYNLFKSKTYVKNPMDLRDPFKRRGNKKKSSAQGKAMSQVSGVYNNQATSIEGKPLEAIKIVGVILGQERRAIAKFKDEVAGPDGDTPTYYIKEGMKIGENGAEVRAILPGGVVFVEKIRNVYDQDEYLETVIPVLND